MRIKDLPSEDKPREKAMTRGLNCLSDAELLALIIQFGAHGEGNDAISLAQNLIEKSGGLYTLSNSLYTDLSLKGLGQAKKLKILATFELGKRAYRAGLFASKIASPKECAEKFGRELAFLREEKVKLVSLDSHQRLLREDIISSGNGFSAEADYRKLMKGAVSAAAYYVYLLHNHPSGNPIASQKDIEVTRALVASFSSLGIVLLDHLIVSGNSFYSIREQKAYPLSFSGAS